MENQFESIMDRIRARQSELSTEEAKENETSPQKTSVKQEVLESSFKVFGLSSRSNDSKETAPVYFRPAEPKESTPKSSTSQDPSETTESSQKSATKKTSRFSILAQEQEEFEFDYKSLYNKPKEAYMKGRSPRMSIGETRPAVLCTPAGAAAATSPNIAKPSKSAPEVVSKNGPEIALGMSDFEARRIKFAQPIVNVNYLPNESSIFSGGSSSANDMSTVLGGSAEMMNLTTSSLSCGEMSLNQHVTHENTLINAQSCDNREAILRERINMENVTSEEYGAHTFMRKKVPKAAAPPSEPTSPPKSTSTPKSTSSTATTTTSAVFNRATNIHTLVSSPKPFSKDIGRAIFSPVHFTPKSTSSPKTIPTTEAVLSPSQKAAVEGSVATTRRLQFEQQLRKNVNTNVAAPAPVPTPRHVVPTIQKPTAPPMQSTPHHPYVAQQKKILFPPSATKTSTLAAKPLVATAPIPVQTQWRGQANTPVVQGARADDKTAGTQLVGAGVGKLKNLKSRWEFCSSTGTPIHPDATEDSLIATAIKMKESTIPTRIGFRPASYGRNKPSASSLHSQNDVRSNTASPIAKNIRYGEGYEDEEDDDVFDDESHQNSEENDEISVIDDIASTDTSRFIDNAFGFMEGPGTGTPSPFREAPLAKQESPLSPLKRLKNRSEVIEEEDVQEISDEEDEDEVTEIATAQPEVVEEPPVYNNKRTNDSGLAYSVSFYRKVQRERVGETLTPLSSVSPSAPVASLTSPQKLKQLTSSSRGDSSPGGRIIESAQEAFQRVSDALKIEQELVVQSQRALARARDQPSFRGSREEFEAQRAVLVHAEKYRALKIEQTRLQTEGARIVDGPRGTLSIVQLAVNLDRDFVKNYIESSSKPEEVFYFVAVLRYAEQVDVSKLVTSDGGVNRKGTLEFPCPMKLTAIPPDFRAALEIYGQKSMRESTTHEDKFKLKSSTMKAKNRPTFLGGGSTSSANQSLFTSSSSKDPVCQYGETTRFTLLATIPINLNSRGRSVHNLPHNVYPLAGELQMKIKKEAVDGADILFRGFLSMYQRTNEGLGSWTRYWSVLENGEMKFWRQPEDEGTKSYLVLMDLSTCCRPEGASTVNDICPFPNSFHIDVWAPKDDPDEPRGIMQLRVMLAADTAQDLQKWLSVINATSRQLCTWRNPIQL